MNDLTVGSESRVIIKFAMPMLLGNLFQQAYNFINSIIIGRLIGDEALAAVGASFPIIFALISFVIGIGSGATIIIAQYFGAKNYNQVRKAVDTIMIFMFFASILIMIIGISFSRQIFEFTNLPKEVIPYATIYLNTFLYGTILLFGFNGISAILRGMGDSKTPLYFLLASCLLNVVLDFVFIKYFHWGIRGAAVSTVVAYGASFIAAVIYLNKNHKLIRIGITNLTFDRAIFKHSIRIGIPSGLQQTFVALGMIALYSIINRFDTSVITAYSIAGRIDSLAILPAMTFGQALSTFVGQNIGAGKIERVHKGLLATIYISIAVSLFTTLFVIAFRYGLMSLFTKNTDVIHYGTQYLVIVGSAYFIFSIMFSLNGIIRGAGETIIPMFITLFSLWIIRIPFAALLSGRFYAFLLKNRINFPLPELFHGKLSERGIWLSIPIAWTVGAICSFVYYKSGNWKNKVLFKQKQYGL